MADQSRNLRDHMLPKFDYITLKMIAENDRVLIFGVFHHAVSKAMMSRHVSEINSRFEFRFGTTS